MYAIFDGMHGINLIMHYQSCNVDLVKLITTLQPESSRLRKRCYPEIYLQSATHAFTGYLEMTCLCSAITLTQFATLTK